MILRWVFLQVIHIRKYQFICPTICYSTSRWLLLFQVINPLSANPTKWSNTLKQFVGKLPTNYLSKLDHFVGLVLKGLTHRIQLAQLCLSHMKISYLISNKNQLTGPYNGIISLRDRLQISFLTLSEFKRNNQLLFPGNHQKTVIFLMVTGKQKLINSLKFV